MVPLVRITIYLFECFIYYLFISSSGHQARDALLLCMALSQKNSNIGTYIAQYSSMSPVLVTGLGGLYSVLPNSIEITSIDWHRITPDDVTEIPELTSFMNSLEFCNAVVQVAHHGIKTQLLDFMYAGFIVPVLGPAILQVFAFVVFVSLRFVVGVCTKSLCCVNVWLWFTFGYLSIIAQAIILFHRPKTNL